MSSFIVGNISTFPVVADPAQLTGSLAVTGSTANPRIDITGPTSGVAIRATGSIDITGDLIVNGTTTTINSTTLTVDDKNIELGSTTSPSDTSADGGGITLKGASDYTISWTNSTDRWHFNQGIQVDGYPLVVKKDNDHTGGAMIAVEQDGTGDAIYKAILTGGPTYTFGIDNSDDNKFKLGYHATSATEGVHTNTLLTVASGGGVGIGEDTPQAKLHVKSGESSVSTFDTKADDLIIENNTNAGISIAGGAIHVVGLYFPDASDPDLAYVKYDHGSNAMAIRTNGTDAINISSTQAATFSGTLTAPTVTVQTALVPDAQDGAALGTSSLQFSDLFLADGAVVSFGDDNEVTLTHNADKGLLLKHTATADDKPVSLTLQTGETDIAANDVLGKIDFQAPDEGTGTDAILVAAGIEAVSEGDFAADNNATKLSFKTAASEAASEKMALSSAGNLSIAGDLTVTGADVVLGADSDGTDRTVTFGHSTLKTIMGIDDSADAFVINTDAAFDGTLANNSLSIDASHNMIVAGNSTVKGRIICDDTTAATSTTDGSLQTDGGLSVALDAVVGDDLILLSDASVIHFGTNSEITLTHDHDKGLLLKHTATGDDKPVSLTLQTGETDIAAADVIGKIDFQAPDEGTGTDAILVAAGIEAVSEGDFAADNNATRLVFKTAASEAAAEKMTLMSDGKVGIGVADPDSKLEVLSTSTQAKFSYDSDSFSTITVADGGGTTIATSETGPITLDPGSGTVFVERDGNRLRFDVSTGTSFIQNDIDNGNIGFRINTENGSIVEMARFEAAGDGALLMNAAIPIQFRDTATHISSTSANVLDITAPTLDIGATTAVTMTTPSVVIDSATSEKPVLEIKNTNADANGATIQLTKDGASVADNDVVGNLTFVSEDDGSNAQTYANIVTAIDVDAAGEESGKLSLKVASHDGGVEDGLVLTGGSADAEVDVTIGNGAASVVSVPGFISIGGVTINDIDTAGEFTDSDEHLMTAAAINDRFSTSGGGASALDDLSDASFGSGDLTITGLDTLTTSASAHNAAGTNVLIQGGNTTAGTTNNIAGGNLTLAAGQGKGSGVGGSIVFKTADGGGSGSSLNALATALTITDDLLSTFEGRIITDDNTNATSTTDGSIQTDGGLSVALDAVIGDDILLLSDASVIHFGTNSEVTLTHDHDKGLLLKHTATGDDKPVSLTLQTGETDIQANDVIGKIDFQAPDEGTGTDAILVAAGIEAVSEGNFAADNNATKLSFKTGASEAAAEKMSLSSGGNLTISGDLTVTGNDIKDSGGSAAITFDGSSNVAVAGALTVGGGIGSTGVTVSAAGAISADARIITDDTTNATSTTDGSIQTDGGLSVALDAVIGDDLKLLSDAAVIHFGTNSEVTLTHVHNEGLQLAHTASGDNTPVKLTLKSEEDELVANEVIGALDFKGGDSGGTDAVLVCAGIEAVATAAHASDNNSAKLSFKTATSETAAEKMALSAAGDLSIVTDGASAKFGADSEVVLQHVHNTGLLLYDGSGASTTKLMFGDSATFIQQQADGQLGIDADSIINITAPTVDIDASTAVTIDGPSVVVTNAATNTPVLEIKNTHNGATAGILKFNNLEGSTAADGADGDDLGSIQFWGFDDGTPTAQQYAGILAEISDASSGAEGGKLSLQVAEHDGTVTTGLLLQDGNADGEIDVTIGAGTDSLTTIAGDTLFTGIPRMNTQSVDLGSATSGTITPTAPLVFVDVDSINADASAGAFIATMGTASATNGDVVHLVFTSAANENLIFMGNGGHGNILSNHGGGKLLGLPSSNGAGGAATLVYVSSVSKWVVLGTNGILTL